MKKNGFAALAAITVIVTAHGEETISPPADAALIYQMTLSDEGLSGPGAALILNALPDAQFVLVGEEHGFADAPLLAKAIARAGREYGLVHHVVETGPLAEAWASDILMEKGADGLAQKLQGRPLSIPFLSMRQDAELALYFLEHARRKSDAVWGVDQEFVGSTLIHFETLAQIAKSKIARDMAEGLLTAEREAFASGNQGALFMLTADADKFNALRTAFLPEKHAARIIKSLEESASIYQLYGQGLNYASNTERVALMRKQFIEQYRSQKRDAPRALFKFGANHMSLGTTYLNTFDLGSLTEGIASGQRPECITGLSICRLKAGIRKFSRRPMDGLVFPIIGPTISLSYSLRWALKNMTFQQITSP